MSKKIKSTWIYDDVKVEFSEPSIQAWESVVHAKSVKDILYYYYTMTVYRRNDKKKWKREFISYACDFQALLCVNGMAEELLKDDFDGGTWQKTQIPDSDGIIWYKKSIDTAGIINEDIYRLARTVRPIVLGHPIINLCGANFECQMDFAFLGPHIVKTNKHKEGRKWVYDEEEVYLAEAVRIFPNKPAVKETSKILDVGIGTTALIHYTV